VGRRARGGRKSRDRTDDPTERKADAPRPRQGVWKPSRADAWLLVPAAVFLFRLWTLSLSSFGAYFGDNEAVYSMIARGYSRWNLLPALHGNIFYDTPPLAGWVIAVSFRAFGESEFAARLPSLLLVVPTLLGVWLLARRFFGKTAAV